MRCLNVRNRFVVTSIVPNRFAHLAPGWYSISCRIQVYIYIYIYISSMQIASCRTNFVKKDSTLHIDIDIYLYLSIYRNRAFVAAVGPSRLRLWLKPWPRLLPTRLRYRWVWNKSWLVLDRCSILRADMRIKWSHRLMAAMAAWPSSPMNTWPARNLMGLPVPRNGHIPCALTRMMR